jgi:hypothetical protein
MERVTAICIFDDVIEFGGAVAAQYIPSFLPFVFQHCAHVDVEIRQACLYGVGVMAQVHSARAVRAQQGGEGKLSAYKCIAIYIYIYIYISSLIYFLLCTQETFSGRVSAAYPLLQPHNVSHQPT